jgi:hypothetical protein
MQISTTSSLSSCASRRSLANFSIAQKQMAPMTTIIKTPIKAEIIATPFVNIRISASPSARASTAYGSNQRRSLAIFLNGSPSALALRRTAKVVRFRALAIVSAPLALKTSSRSSLSLSGVQGRRGVPVMFLSPSAHLQLSRPDFSQNYLYLSGA